MNRRLLLLALFPALLGGCASTETVKEAAGQGAVRTYQASYEAVFDAAAEAAKASELEVDESDRSAGRLVLSHGVTLWSWGERIAVFVRRKDATLTEVEIVSKPVMSPLNFPPDWQQILLDRIAVDLRSGR